MNVLALYDIHGNVDALEAVLADPRGRDADVVLVGGDAVPGRSPRATLARLDALTIPVHWMRGNGEREVAEAVDGAGARRTTSRRARRRSPRPSSATSAARALGEVPLTLELDGVLYCHASPRRDDEMLTRLSPPERWADALGGVDAALVVAGHTHQQDDRTVGGTRFINAGSVGLPYEGDGAARWLWVADGVPALRADRVRRRRAPAAASWRPAGRTNARSGPRSSSRSTRSS